MNPSHSQRAKHLAAFFICVSPVLATVTPFAEYHLGEAGSLDADNRPQDSSGNDYHFTNDINGGTATVETTGVLAPGSSAYLDTSAVTPNQGWYGNNLFTGLPTDDFAFGVFVRADSNIPANRGDIFTLGGGSPNGSFKISLANNGWGASAHSISWIGPEQGVTGSFTDNVWVHLALIRSGGSTLFYIDGVAQGIAYAGVPVHNSPHLSVDPGGIVYFDGQVDEARVVTFTAGETSASILAALQGGSWPPPPPKAFVRVGPTATWGAIGLSTDEESIFRIGGASDDFATVTDTDGLSVVAGTAPKQVINIEPQDLLAAGIYPLIDYSGSIGGLGVAGLEVELPGRYVKSLEDNTVDTTIDLVITGAGPENLVWTAASDSTWDVETTANWKFATGGTSTTFFSDDSVLFDDTASSGTVTLSGTIAPSLVEIENSSMDYVFGGDGISGFAELEKFGTGTVTFTNPNDYTGMTFISAGRVRLGPGGTLGGGLVTNDGVLEFANTDPLTMANAIDGIGTLEKTAAGTLLLSGNSSFSGDVSHQAGILQSGHNNCLGDTLGLTTVAAGATLDINGIGFGNESLNIIGAGIGGEGVIINSGAPDTTGAFELVLIGDATIGGTSRWDVRGGDSLVDGDFTLTKVGGNQISCVESSVTVRNIEVTNGSFGIEFGALVDETYPGTITVSGGMLSFGDFGTPVICEKPIVLNGGILRGVSTGASIDSPVSLDGTNNEIGTIGGATLVLKGSVSGSGSLGKTDVGTLILITAPAFTGDTAVDAGTLVLDVSGLDDSSGVSIGASAILELNFAGSDTVDTLSIGGSGQPAGSYDSSHSSGNFTGTGTLVVTTGSASAYDTWAAGFPDLTDSNPDLDFELDGLETGIEYVVGGDPTVNDAASVAPTIGLDGSVFEFDYRRTDQANDDPNTTIEVEYSLDLTSWTNAEEGVDGVSITVNDDFYGAGIDQVIVSLPASLSSGGVLFARLNVSMP